MEHLGRRRTGYEQASQEDRSERPRLEQSPHSQHSTYGKPVPFNLRRQVFLSHSGRDKEFVRHLHKALCSSYQGIKVSFFDEESIPKAEAVSMENILEEARKSKLGVLVLTEDFFTHTRNPMLELEAFVAAKVKLLPLFLKMSVEQFKEKERRDRWMKRWREWSAVDDKLVNLESWGHALNLVSTFSGLEFCKIATCEIDYIDKIVKQVIRTIGPAIPLSKAEVIHGRDRLCRMADAMYEKAASKQFSSAQNVSTTQAASYTSPSSFGPEEECCNITSTVVGIHGFTGLGKSTLCKWLCDYYHGELNGRVCYIDVGLPCAAYPEQNPAFSFRGRLQHVLRSLSPCNNAMDNLQFLHDDQLENVLRAEFSSMEDPVFFAIDNITSEWESREEAYLYLSCKFPRHSRIFLTSRSESVLANLIHQYEGSFSVAIAYMPRLEFQEARDILVWEFPQPRKLGLTLLNQQELDDLNECVKLCTIHNEWYHPLMLKSLAAFLKWDRSTPKDADWKGSMMMLLSKGIEDRKGDVWRKVFSVFELTFQSLSEETRQVFLDLVLFNSIWRRFYTDSSWISMVHSHLRETELENILLQLEDTCFIGRHVFYWLERSEVIEIHDLMVDFGKYKAKQEGAYVVVHDSTVWPDHDLLPTSARHISISRVNCKASGTQPLDLRNLEMVKVLHLVNNAGLQEVLLNATTCAHLRSLILIAPKHTTLRCTLDEDRPSSSPLICGGQFLRWLQIEGDVSFQCTGASQLSERGLLRGNHDTTFQSLTELEISSKVAGPAYSILTFPCNVEVLRLFEMPNVQSIDLTACANLKEAHFDSMPSLKFIRGPEGGGGSIGCNERLARITIDSANEGLMLRYLIFNCPCFQLVSWWEGSGAGERRTYPEGSLVLNNYKLRHEAKELAVVRLEDFFGRFTIEDTEADCSKCKADVPFTFIWINEFTAVNMLANVGIIELYEAEHIAHFVSALFEAKPERLSALRITCKTSGDCGCEQNAPHFTPLLYRGRQSRVPSLVYHCPQVKDLASLAQWHSLRCLQLHGCKSVEVWPDFTAMTSLEILDLRNTSLKELSASMLSLPHLMELDLSGCRELSAKELLVNGAIGVSNSMTSAHFKCRVFLLANLGRDLREGTRDRGSVAEALGALSGELGQLFNRSHSSSSIDALRLLSLQKLVVEIMHVVWFGERYDDEAWYTTYVYQIFLKNCGSVITDQEWQRIRREMQGLLCCESFLSLPFRMYKKLVDSEPAWDELKSWIKETSVGFFDSEEKSANFVYAVIAALGLALVGGAMSFECCDASLIENHVTNFIQSKGSYILMELRRVGEAVCTILGVEDWRSLVRN